MDATVKLLRQQGRRKPQHLIHDEPGLRGRLALATGGGWAELRLASPDPGQLEPLAVLYDARLVTLHGDTLHFRGIEYQPDGTEHIQEWTARARAPDPQRQLFAAERQE
jgi:hypothetical protein